MKIKESGGTVNLGTVELVRRQGKMAYLAKFIPWIMTVLVDITQNRFPN